MAFADLYEHAMRLDGLLTGRHESETAQTANHQADVLNDVVAFASGRNVYYLSDSGYSRIYIGGSGQILLTANSTDKVKQAFQTPEAVEAARAFGAAVTDLMERLEAGIAAATLNSARGIVPGR
jgi:hypothetical protein